MTRHNGIKRTPPLLLTLLAAMLSFGLMACEGSQGPPGVPGQDGSDGAQGPPGPPGPGGVVDNGTSVEACAGCHDQNAAVPVADINSDVDAHFIDANSDGLATASGYRQLNVAITSVDVTGANVLIAFDVTDESGAPVTDIFASDGRFTIAKLRPPASGDPSFWQSLIERTEDPGGVGDGPGTPEQQATGENFTTNGGVFQNLGGGSYSYTSVHDPSGGNFPVAASDSMRVAIQLSAGDLPAGNGWCNFDANLAQANDCATGSVLTRDIVQTATCNTCHGATDDTKLAIHGGGRTDVEYCVTCHNPGTTDANSGNTVNMTEMVHKIHYGANLANGYKIWGFRNSLHDYSNVNFTKDIDDCTICHSGGGADETNWATQPSREACGSCHDDVNFDTGENHATGITQPDNQFCTNCHPATGPQTAVMVAHRGVARAVEGNLYAGNDGYAVDALAIDPASGDLLIDFSVSRGGALMDLTAAPEWTAPAGASRLAVLVAWASGDYTNEGSGSTPGLPISINGLDVGGAVTDNMDGTYRIQVALPSGAGDTVTVGIEGHPAADLDGDGTYSDRIAVVNAYDHFNVESRGTVTVRNDIIDIAKCNACHDAAGQGISLHGNNRTGEMQVCAVCHNSDATDINRRPMDPTMTADGKVEEAIDMKRMIHQIHSGSELQDGIVIWGFGFPGTEHDFSDVNFIGNRANCETCHMPGTYGTEDARSRLATTISTGTDPADPGDDLNISQTASVCSSCHDDAVAKDHMVLNGASFIAEDADIR